MAIIIPIIILTREDAKLMVWVDMEVSISGIYFNELVKLFIALSVVFKRERYVETLMSILCFVRKEFKYSCTVSESIPTKKFTTFCTLDTISGMI